MAKIEGYLPDNDGMKKAFTGADMVIIPAGIPRELHIHLSPTQNKKAISKVASAEEDDAQANQA